MNFIKGRLTKIAVLKPMDGEFYEAENPPPIMQILQLKVTQSQL